MKPVRILFNWLERRKSYTTRRCIYIYIYTHDYMICLNICFSYKSRKNWSNFTNFEHVFDISNLRSHNKNYDCTLDFSIGQYQNLFKSSFSHYFWLSTPVSIIFCCWKGLVFMAMLLWIILPYDNLKFVCLSIWTFLFAKI